MKRIEITSYDQQGNYTVHGEFFAKYPGHAQMTHRAMLLGLTGHVTCKVYDAFNRFSRPQAFNVIITEG